MKARRILNKLLSLETASAILVIAGAVLIVLSAAWRFAVAPALKIVSSDFDNFYSYEGEVNLLAADRVIRKIPVIVEQRQFNRLELTTSKISAVEEHTRLLHRNTKEKIAERKCIFKINRRTSELLPGDAYKMHSRRSAYYIVFPFSTPETKLYFDVGLSIVPLEARYDGKRKTRGVELLEFVLKNDESYEVKEEHEMFIRQIISLLPGEHVLKNAPLFWNENKNQENFSSRLLVNYKARVLVEPLTGTVTGVRDVRETYSFVHHSSLVSSHMQMPVAFAEIRYSMRESSFKDALNLAKDEREKINLQFKYIPIGFLLIGIASIFTGAVTGIKEKS